MIISGIKYKTAISIINKGRTERRPKLILLLIFWFLSDVLRVKNSTLKQIN